MTDEELDDLLSSAHPEQWLHMNPFVSVVWGWECPTPTSAGRRCVVPTEIFDRMGGPIIDDNSHCYLSEEDAHTALRNAIDAYKRNQHQ